MPKYHSIRKSIDLYPEDFERLVELAEAAEATSLRLGDAPSWASLVRGLARCSPETGEKIAALLLEDRETWHWGKWGANR